MSPPLSNSLLVRRAAEGFTPLTTALQLGLYRDGTHLGIEDAREVELRRRVWSSVYHHDRSQSLLVGRPCLISDSSCDTKPPANLEDLDLDLISEFPPGGRPMSQPTTMTYTVLRHSLAVIMGKISQRIFSLSHPSYNTVVEIDQELIEWKHNLPSYFKVRLPTRITDSTQLRLMDPSVCHSSRIPTARWTPSIISSHSTAKSLPPSFTQPVSRFTGHTCFASVTRNSTNTPARLQSRRRVPT